MKHWSYQGEVMHRSGRETMNLNIVDIISIHNEYRNLELTETTIRKGRMYNKEN
jgi:hypothetical protein